MQDQKQDPVQRLAYRIEEVAKLVGNVSPNTIRREIHAGHIKAFRPRPSRTAPLLVTRDELLRWISEHASNRVFLPPDGHWDGDQGDAQRERVDRHKPDRGSNAESPEVGK